MNCPHCNIPIDEHEALRCLDAWVAEAVMGWTNCKPKEALEPWEFWDEPPRIRYGLGEPPESEAGKRLRGLIPEYSIFIAAAWDVVEKIAKINYIDIGVDEHGAQVQIDVFQDDRWELAFVESTRAATAPLAICRAALLAVQQGDDKSQE